MEERLPLPGWPSRGELAYVREAILTALLLIALPWLVVKLLTQPSLVLAGVGRDHVRGGAPR